MKFTISDTKVDKINEALGIPEERTLEIEKKCTKIIKRFIKSPESYTKTQALKDAAEFADRIEEFGMMTMMIFETLTSVEQSLIKAVGEGLKSDGAGMPTFEA